MFLDAVQASGLALDRRSVVVVNELGLLGTRQGLALLWLQAERGFRLAMLGDDRQSQAIEAGPIIDLLRRALGPAQIPEILTTIRQHSEREREIAGHWREGRAAEALALKRADGTAELVPGGYRETMERVAAVAEARLRAHAGDPGYSLTVSAPTNVNAHRLGLALRKVRRRLGQVGPDQVRVQAVGRDGQPYAMALAAGDRVRLLASTPAEGQGGTIGRNGLVLTVLAADAQGLLCAAPAGARAASPGPRWPIRQGGSAWPMARR